MKYHTLRTVPKSIKKSWKQRPLTPLAWYWHFFLKSQTFKSYIYKTKIHYQHSKGGMEEISTRIQTTIEDQSEDWITSIAKSDNCIMLH